MKTESVGKIFGIVFILLIYLSCTSNEKMKDDNIEMIEYVTSKNDTIMIPRNIEDYNRFIDDSLDDYNTADYLFAMLESKPEEGFIYTFDDEKYDVSLKTIMAPDSTMKFYCINRPYRRGYNILIQYKNHTGIHLDTFDEGLYSGGVYNIYYVRDIKGNIFYLVDSYGKVASLEESRKVIALTFKEGKPQKTPLFNTGKKRLFSIDTYLEYYHTDRNTKIDSINVYNEQTRNLYIPLLDKYGDFHDKFIIYHFDGTEFKYSGIR